MADPTQLLMHGGRAPGERPIVYGTVSELQPAPGTFADPLFVVLPHDLAHAIRIDPQDWPQIHGATLPALGARVTLAHDDYHNWICLAWRGTHS